MSEPILKPCDCQSWKDNIGKVEGPMVNEALRYGTSGYRGEHFRFCPWCGKPLVVDRGRK